MSAERDRTHAQLTEIRADNGRLHQELNETRETVREALAQRDEAQGQVAELQGRLQQVEQRLATLHDMIHSSAPVSVQGAAVEGAEEGSTADHMRTRRDREPPALTRIEVESIARGFRNVDIIGRGGSGQVYRGFYRGRAVAIKKLQSQFAEHFDRELRVM